LNTHWQARLAPLCWLRPSNTSAVFIDGEHDKWNGDVFGVDLRGQARASREY